MGEKMMLEGNAFVEGSTSGRLANNSGCRSVAATRSESVTETCLILTPRLCFGA